MTDRQAVLGDGPHLFGSVAAGTVDSRHIIPKDRSTNYSIRDNNAVPKQNLPLYQNYDTENSEWMTKLTKDS
jgi:hypothetical protein